MSRIGKKPIALPTGITVSVMDHVVKVKGPKGELNQVIDQRIAIEIEGNTITLAPASLSKKTAAVWGLSRSLIANMVEGVNSGFEKKLDIEGIGYRVNLEGTSLNLQLGFSHPIKVAAPEGIQFTVERNSITVRGIDKQLVGQVAARVRKLKPPEPYKGKGIRYRGEMVRRKAGKKASA